MDNYPGNSIYGNDQPERKKLKRVTNNLVSSKKSVTQRIKEALIGEDIVDNIIVPGVQNLILDGLERVFFHGNSTRHSQNYWTPPQGSYYYGNPSYDSYYQYGGYNNQNPQQPPLQRNKPDYRSIIVKGKNDAEMVVNQLIMRIRECRYASVADLFDLVGCPGDYTDTDWGWLSPNGIGIRRVSQGFLIVVPEAQPVNMNMR